ncbi:MAG: BNR-4 repeat-containing protein [Candidatus Hydrogenedentes bacterium]|nr:BNR-4 repeat-containing protein [Candidatus Hydrogenedentota bacterium]
MEVALGEQTESRETRFYTYTRTVDGYRGIWFTLGQIQGEYGDKYSAGSAFAWSHTLTPMAVYAPEADKTFFVYSGTTSPEERYLLTMAAYYDHTTGRVPRPTIVRDQRGVDDPHDNASIAIDEDGRVWVFVAGRGRHRPGQIFRATAPYSVAEFEQIAEREQTYSQVWPVPGRGFLHLLTKYTRGRELYWETSPDGRAWSGQRKLAGFGGHYEVSRLHGAMAGTAFNYHPGGNVDKRTNLYYIQTADFGATWTTVSGETVETPLAEKENPALVLDYESEGRNVYIQKLIFDGAGRPAILYLTSRGHEPGPENGPREWRVTRWTGGEWATSTVTESDHNYDAGSFYIEGDRWTVIAPALAGPQPWHTGGEVGLWASTDAGATWALERQVTRDSTGNHSYIRRPHNPRDPFYAFWADADSSAFSPSRIHFTNSGGTRVFTLPYSMEGDDAAPIPVE